ncbi:PP2C family protein-serine/threonine phosphatase [Arsenicibacter rosenii]|nr:protein phosphatase 2C domain-containing protein [Arsenicibacter rosenii]
METHLPLSFTETGQRPTNQDALYPAAGIANHQTRVFVVCDGMGGADKGEVASRLLCEAFARYEAVVCPAVFTRDHLREVVEQALSQYGRFMRSNPLINRIGSTVAFLHLHEQGATVAHIGDSRVFQVRNGKVIFQTRDHKQVNDMVDAGIITADQALRHPWRNRLSRSVSLSSTDLTGGPISVPEPEVVHLNDVCEDDYFVLCSDGMLEQVDEPTLETILSAPVSDEDKLRILLQRCENQVKDNYSGYVVHIKSVGKPKPVATASRLFAWF